MTKIKIYFYKLLGGERLESWMRFYIHHRNLYGKGRGEVDFLRSLAPLQSLMLLWLFLKSVFGDIPNWVVYIGIPVIVIGKAVLHWCVGYLWEENRVFDKENDWNNDRNEAMRKINGREIKVTTKRSKCKAR